jgi:predicted O-methyltransferase YrrM
VIADDDFDLVFIDAAAGDYRVRPPYSGVGADVSTLGAAIAARTSATAAPAALQRSSN